MKKRRNYAVFAFVLAFIFFGAEVFAVCTAKNQYDYDRAKKTAEELSVELGLISSSLNSGNKKLYDDSVSRYRATLAEFSENEYSFHRQPELLNRLRDYSNKLKDDETKLNEFMELSAALSSIHLELQLSNNKKFDAANFYRIEATFQNLRESLDKVQSEELKDLKAKLDSFAQDIISLSEGSAICVSVCPKSSFEEKQKKMQELKTRYEKDFEALDSDASKDYNPSDLILGLAAI